MQTPGSVERGPGKCILHKWDSDEDVIRPQVDTLCNRSSFQANFRAYLLFMGSCFKAANVSLSPRRQESYFSWCVW